MTGRAKAGRPGRWPCHCKFPPPALTLARELTEPRRVMREKGAAVNRRRRPPAGKS